VSPAAHFPHEFVTAIPEPLEESVLYISIHYATAAHLCACGCGREVVTPIAPTDWQLTFDGEVVSLHPSIGNWSFPCQSHYFIKRGRVRWAPRCSREQIDRGRERDRIGKKRHVELRDRATRTSSRRARGRRHVGFSRGCARCSNPASRSCPPPANRRPPRRC
jgi:hypothetical protein